MTNELLVDTSDLVHIDNTETINGLKYFSYDTVVANASQMITNCITKIPQDIKLELNNGTLTLKAGSKVYVPNGFEQDGTTRHFDIEIVQNDISCIYGSNEQYLIYTSNHGIYLKQNTLQSVISGDTDTGAGWYVWYDTATNRIKRYHGDEMVEDYCSLPVAIANSDSSKYISIDQVFNGFGYIGSTVFALPGVKGLIPNGKNINGTLDNISFATTNVLTFTNATGSATYRDAVIALENDNSLSLSRNLVCYDKYANLNHDTTLSGAVLKMISIGCMHLNNGVISSFNLKSTFHALDYNDLSTNIPDYTAGVAITSPYTPSVNGIIIAQKTSGYSTAEISVTNGPVIARHQSADSTSSTNYIAAIVKAGQSYTISAGSMTFYPFIRA